MRDDNLHIRPQAAGATRVLALPMCRSVMLSTIIVVSALFLVFLGMRAPSLNHHGGPRSHPRAVVENIFKSPVANYEMQPDNDLHGPTVVLAASAETEPLSFESASVTPAPATTLLPSRAPPA